MVDTDLEKVKIGIEYVNGPNDLDKQGFKVSPVTYGLIYTLQDTILGPADKSAGEISRSVINLFPKEEVDDLYKNWLKRASKEATKDFGSLEDVREISIKAVSDGYHPGSKFTQYTISARYSIDISKKTK